MRVLVADDNADNRYQLEVMLTVHGHDALLAANGAEALDQLQEGPVDLIVSDILMPRMDGYTFCRECKQNDALKDIPFIFVTAAYTDEKDEVFALSLGADRFIRRPVEPDALMAVIDEVLAAPRESREPATAGPKEDALYLAEYSQRLVSQLERKVSELEREMARRERLERALRILSHCNQVLVYAADEAGLLEQMCRTIVSVGQFRLAWVGYAEENETLRPVAKAGEDAGYPDSLKLSLADADLPAAEAIRSRKTFALADVADAPPSAWREEALKQGFRSVVALPLEVGGKIIGALSIDAAEANAFGEQETALLAELSNDLSYGIGALRAGAAKEEAEDKLFLAGKVFDSSAEGIMITNFDREIVSVNRAFIEITGYRPGEAIGRNPRFLASGEHDREFYRTMWATIDQTGHWAGEIWNRRKNGDVYPEWLDITAVRNEEGDVVNYVGIFSDISQRKELESTVWHLSQFDALTNLPNRLLLNDRLNSAVSVARRTGGKFAVFSVNLDHFKVINDAFGFAAGDAILLAVAQRLKDSVPEGSTLSRFERDNFIVIVDPLEKGEDAGQVAQTMLDAVCKPYLVDGRDVRLTASVGVSFFPVDGDTAPELLKNADVAMTRAREMGRNTYRLFDREMDERTHEVLVLETDLHSALERNQLRIRYQPQMDLANGEIIGVEALLRWQHPVFGEVLPTRFIPIAEATGLIIPIGEWVLREACRQVVAWQAAGFPALRLAVNVSALQTMQAKFAQRVQEILAETGFNPSLLELELTESLFLEATDSTTSNLAALKKAGVQFSVDDFGTGYAGFHFLQFGPVGKIKIDKSFIDHVTQRPSDAAIIQAITAMGRGLDLKVIAEGVENEAQMKYLRSVLCDEIQGFHLSQPLPAEGVLPFLVREQPASRLKAASDLP